MSALYKVIVWVALVAAVAVPVGAAALSPLLEWRTTTYIAAGFAGIFALCLMLFQPLLAAGSLPGLPIRRSRKLHRWVGAALFLMIMVHIIGLWITSPPDVIDALLFASPTPFSIWGVIAMWCVIASVVLAAIRPRFRLRMRAWQISHKVLAGIAVIGTAIHALKIEGAMETLTKTALCILVVTVTAWVLFNIRARLESRKR